MTINLTPRAAADLEALTRDGSTADEVIERALTTLAERESVEAALREAVADVEAGRTYPLRKSTPT
ncbi:MAG: hypothetical protein AAF532_08135 [Planctomycetota bacterium]